MMTSPIAPQAQPHAAALAKNMDGKPADVPPWRAILDLARWAPSGDNTQPWRFELVGPGHLRIHGHDTREHCVYDLRGEASQVSLGTLLLTLETACAVHGWRATVRRDLEAPEALPRFDVELQPLPACARAPRWDAQTIRRRSVQRRPMPRQALPTGTREAVQAALPAGYTARWFEGEARDRLASLIYRNARLRLALPEAYPTHSSIIEWNATTSVDRIPDAALGADPASLKAMRWGLGSPARVRFANRFLAGTWLPPLQMDWLPARGCAAHMLILGPAEPQGIDDQVAAGRAVQSAWLELTRLGLWQQPEQTPLIFARYLRQDQDFTRDPRCQRMAQALARDFADRIGAADAPRAIWLGRVGAGPGPTARSVRQPLAHLVTDPAGWLDRHPPAAP